MQAKTDTTDQMAAEIMSLEDLWLYTLAGVGKFLKFRVAMKAGQAPQSGMLFFMPISTTRASFVVGFQFAADHFQVRVVSGLDGEAMDRSVPYVDGCDAFAADLRKFMMGRALTNKAG
jgi:hypothetical protein